MSPAPQAKTALARPAQRRLPIPASRVLFWVSGRLPLQATDLNRPAQVRLCARVRRIWRFLGAA